MENKKLGIFFMVIATLGMALMATCVKVAGNGINTFEKLFYRNLIAVIVAFYGMRKAKFPLMPNSKKSFKFLMYRSLVGLAGGIFFFYAISYLPLADSAMLNKLSPFWVIIFASVFLKEKFYKIQIIPIITVFIGAIMVIKPTFNITIIPAISGLLSSIMAGTAYALVRYLRTMEHPNTIVFYFAIVSIVITAPLMFIFGYKVPSTLELLALFGAGIFAFIAQLSLSYAYKYSKANEISIYQYLTIIFSGIIGLVFLKEIPDLYSLIGGSLIIISAISNFYITNKVIR